MIPFLFAFPPPKSLTELCPISTSIFPKPLSLFLYSLPHYTTDLRALSSSSLQLSIQTISYNPSFFQLILPPSHINIKTYKCKSAILPPLSPHPSLLADCLDLLKGIELLGNKKLKTPFTHDNVWFCYTRI